MAVTSAGHVSIVFDTAIDGGQDPMTWDIDFTLLGDPDPPSAGSVVDAVTAQFLNSGWVSDPPDAWAMNSPGSVISVNGATLSEPFSGAVDPLPLAPMVAATPVRALTAKRRRPPGKPKGT